jgi:hypothetical protein
MVSTWMVSFSTSDGELQHTGWVKITAGTAAGRCRNIFGQQQKVTGTALHFRKFSFFNETSL